MRGPIRIAVVFVATAAVVGAAPAAAQKVMREQVYERLSRAQEATEAGEWDKAAEHLEKLGRMKDLAPGEKAQLHTAYGYLHFAQEKYAESATSYERVLQQEELTEAMRLSTLYTLGQLHFHLEHYDVALGHLQTWLEEAENPGPEPYVLVGQALYQVGRVAEAAAPVRRAIAVAERRGQRVQENWYALLRVFYFETQDFENLLDVLEILVTRFPSKEYWLHLAAAFGEMGDEERRLAAYEAAYAQGFLTSGSEIVLLSQLLLQAEVPYRAGILLRDGLDAGAVESDAGNWRLLAQAWILAQEHDAAIAALGRAAELSDDGELHARIAQSQANLDRWEEAAAAAATALARGVQNPHDLHLLQGMAYFELGRFTEAKTAFAAAQGSPRGRDAATRWLAYVEREQARLRELGVDP